VSCGRYCCDVTCWCVAGLPSGGDLWTVLRWCDMLVRYSVPSFGDLWTVLR
jgi:hypothetical protein